MDEQALVAARESRPLPPSALAVVVAYRNKLSAIRQNYSAHIAAWTPDAIARNRRDDADVVLALQDELKTLMDREERGLHSLLARQPQHARPC